MRTTFQKSLRTDHKNITEDTVHIKKKKKNTLYKNSQYQNQRKKVSFSVWAKRSFPSTGELMSFALVINSTYKWHVSLLVFVTRKLRF